MKIFKNLANLMKISFKLFSFSPKPTKIEKLSVNIYYAVTQNIKNVYFQSNIIYVLTSLMYNYDLRNFDNFNLSNSVRPFVYASNHVICYSDSYVKLFSSKFCKIQKVFVLKNEVFLKTCYYFELFLVVFAVPVVGITD